MSDYAKHAEIWDWAGYDRTPEFEFWYQLAHKYGDTVLSVMAAIGETGVFMAEKGLKVTALDYTKEMINEGKKRFSYLPNIEFVQADARQFSLNKKYDFAFIGSTDLHHMMSEKDVKSVLKTIKEHLNVGGGLGLELWYPAQKSWESPKRRFDPLTNNKTIKAWKEGSTSFNAETKRIKISQEVYKQKDNKIEQFTHEFEMQLYSRIDIIKIVNECGYKLITEYGDYNFNPWEPNSNKWLMELKVE